MHDDRARVKTEYLSVVLKRVGKPLVSVGNSMFNTICWKDYLLLHHMPAKAKTCEAFEYNIAPNSVSVRIANRFSGAKSHIGALC